MSTGDTRKDGGEQIGVCPRCGGPIYITKDGFRVCPVLVVDTNIEPQRKEKPWLSLKH
jgi:uncharacterized Zn finger protein (UPF0148 family)